MSGGSARPLVTGIMVCWYDESTSNLNR